MLRMTCFSLTALLSTNSDGGCGVQRALGSVRPWPPWIYCNTLEVTQVQPRSIVVTGSPWGGCLESESFRLEKTFKIIKPNHQPDCWLWLYEGRGRRGCWVPAGHSPFEGLRATLGQPHQHVLNVPPRVGKMWAPPMDTWAADRLAMGFGCNLLSLCGCTMPGSPGVALRWLLSSALGLRRRVLLSLCLFL